METNYYAIISIVEMHMAKIPDVCRALEDSNRDTDDVELIGLVNDYVDKLYKLPSMRQMNDDAFRHHKDITENSRQALLSYAKRMHFRMKESGENIGGGTLREE